MDEMPYVDAGGRVYNYGEFFPIEMSAFAYNEALVQEFFPISKKEAVAAHFPWRDEPERNYKITTSGDILKQVIGCAHKGICKDQCTTAFRIIPEELAMYRAMNLSLPTLCPNCRHFGRLAKRNPMKLWARACAREGCKNTFETSYAPDRHEKVYCIECYQQEIS